MDGGLTAAVLVSPPHHLRTTELLSKRWGPPQTGLQLGLCIATRIRIYVSSNLHEVFTTEIK
jgi:hypothetical protein